MANIMQIFQYDECDLTIF